MDSDMLALVFRGTERLIIALAALCAIWFGYKLFDRVVSDKSGFEGSVGKWSVKLQRIAPGVFFALFGAGVLAFALQSPLSQEREGSWTKLLASGGGATQEGKDHQTIIALTAVIKLAGDPEVLGTVKDDQRLFVQSSAQRLVLLRDALIDGVWGEGWRDKYYRLAQSPGSIDEMNEQDRAVFKAIRDAMGAN